jgi:hypothetical protein
MLCAVGRDRNGWAVRSKAALLLTLVAKRQGPGLVKELLSQLLTIARESPTHTEMVGCSGHAQMTFCPALPLI